MKLALRQVTEERKHVKAICSKREDTAFLNFLS